MTKIKLLGAILTLSLLGTQAFAAGGSSSYVIGNGTATGGLNLITTSAASLYVVDYASATPNDYIVCFDSDSTSGYTAGDFGDQSSLIYHVAYTTNTASVSAATGDFVPIKHNFQQSRGAIAAADGIVCYRVGTGVAIVRYKE